MSGQWAMGNGDDVDSGMDELSYGFSEDGENMRDHRDLEVWRRAMSLSVSVYDATKAFPREEMFGLTSQTRRASVSIPANITEGYGRNSTGAYSQFLRIALGSARELGTLIDLSTRLGYFEASAAAALADECVRIGKCCSRS